MDPQLHSLFGNHARLGLRNHMSSLTAHIHQNVLKLDLDAYDEGHFPLQLIQRNLLLSIKAARRGIRQEGSTPVVIHQVVVVETLAESRRVS